jgi:hypothetical protein
MKDPPPPISVVWCITVFLTHLLATTAVFAVLLKMVPGYEALFRDFGMKLPAMTEWTIYASRCVGNWWFLFPLPLAVDAGIIFGLRTLPPPSRWIATAWAFLVLLAAAVAIVLSMAAMFLPLQTLYGDLSK